LFPTLRFVKDRCAFFPNVPGRREKSPTVSPIRYLLVRKPCPIHKIAVKYSHFFQTVVRIGTLGGGFSAVSEVVQRKQHGSIGRKSRSPLTMFFPLVDPRGGRRPNKPPRCEHCAYKIQAANVNQPLVHSNATHEVSCTGFGVRFLAILAFFCCPHRILRFSCF